MDPVAGPAGAAAEPLAGEIGDTAGATPSAPGAGPAPAAPDAVDAVDASATSAAAPPERGSADDPAVVAAEREERARRRTRQTVRDMVLSMLVVAAVVLVVWMPWSRTTPDPVRTVDAASVLTGARASETWPVLAPRGLPATWRATSARISVAGDGRDVVHVGYLTPDSTYVGLEQSDTRDLRFVTDATVDGRQTGTRTVAGQEWTAYESDDGSHRSLVRTTPQATYVVVGTGDWAQIEGFAQRLQPR